MEVGPLPKQKHEQFAQGIASNLSATKAYTAVYDEGPGNAASACRLLKNRNIANRIQELTGAINSQAEEKLVEVALSDLRKRETRIAWLDDLARRQRNVILARAKDYAQRQAKNGKWVPVTGGDQGMVVPVEGKKAGSELWKYDGDLVRDLRGTLQQIAQECGDWTDKRENRFTDESGRDRPFTLADADRLLHGG